MIQHYVIKLVCKLRQIGSFFLVLRFPPPNETDRHDITEILLRVALNTTTLTLERSDENVVSHMKSGEAAWTTDLSVCPVYMTF